MSFAVDVAVAAAAKIERTAGPAAALGVWRRLASNATAPELRARAILGALRCACALRDVGVVRDLALLWRTVDYGAWEDVFAAIKAFSRAGFREAAIEISHAEAQRMPSAKSLYAYARCLDVARDSRALVAFGEAIALSEKEGAPAIAHASRVRRVAWLARQEDALAQAIEQATKISTAEAAHAERLVLANVLLSSPSRFTRATALGLLDDVVSDFSARAERDADGGKRVRTSADFVSARRALARAARHADDLADDLTPLEIDRLLAIFGRSLIIKETVRAREVIALADRIARARAAGDVVETEAALDEVARLDPSLRVLHERARDILKGRFEPLDPSARDRDEASTLVSAEIWTRILDVASALRDRAFPRATQVLERLAERAERGERLPAGLFMIARVALGTEESSQLRQAAIRLVTALSRAPAMTPRGGWLSIATALALAGAEEAATSFRRRAVLAKEPGAAEALASSLTRAGWRLAIEGERGLALVRLHEARALALRHAAPAANANRTA